MYRICSVLVKFNKTVKHIFMRQIAINSEGVTSKLDLDPLRLFVIVIVPRVISCVYEIFCTYILP